MNCIKVNLLLTPYNYKENYWTIDGKSLPEWLELWKMETNDEKLKNFGTLLGLYPACGVDMLYEGDLRFVWETMDMNDTILPLLVCEDDLDFSCIVIVADVYKSAKYVHWKRIGYVLHGNKDFEKEKRSGILCLEAYTDEDWEKFGDNIAWEYVDSELWKQWISENWEEERFRRNMNYTLPYYQTEGNIRWLKETNWIFDRNEYEEAVNVYRKRLTEYKGDIKK